jgi:GAF domain-containing protein
MGKTGRSSKAKPPESLIALAAYLSLGRAMADDELLRLILEIGVGMMDAEEGSLLLLDRDTEELEFMMTVGRPEAGEELKGQRFSMHNGITGLAASTGEPQTGSPSYREVRQPTYGEGHRNEPEAVLAAPMLVEEDVVGVITAVSFAEGRTFSAADVRLYCKFANLCGTVIRQRLREETVRKILLGEERPAAASPEIERVLAGYGLTPSDRSMAGIARDLARLSHGREDILPLCADLVRTLARIAEELGWQRE